MGYNLPFLGLGDGRTILSMAPGKMGDALPAVKLR